MSKKFFLIIFDDGLNIQMDSIFKLSLIDVFRKKWLNLSTFWILLIQQQLTKKCSSNSGPFSINFLWSLIEIMVRFSIGSTKNLECILKPNVQPFHWNFRSTSVCDWGSKVFDRTSEWKRIEKRSYYLSRSCQFHASR